MSESFYDRFLTAAWNKRVYVYAASLVGRKEVRKRNEVMRESRKQHVSLDVRGRYIRPSVAKVVYAV